ncbi:nucleotide sugar dehydrogenase [Thermoproteota archaeon]
MPYKSLKEKIDSKTLKLGIIGLGYVGLPLACEFAKEGINVTGFDVNNKKVTLLNKGKSYIIDIANTIVKPLVDNKVLSATTDFSKLKEMDAISICVPTPLGKTKDPDMSYIVKAVSDIKKTLRKGQLIILESTTYPGTTEEVILPTLESTGLKVGKDFFLAFSPERVDPGNPIYNTKNTPKVVGGVTAKCSALAKALYQIGIDTIIAVSSPKAAEMVKLLENTFRSVNIAMANEMVLMCDRLQVNPWEVIEAAATKPFGFMPFYPGPGLGGHCIPIDPLYLSWKLKTLDYDARFIQLAGEINESMPHYVVEKTMLILNKKKKSVNGAKILILGVAYKADIDDVRESPALEIISGFKKLGAKVDYHDPFIPQINLNGSPLESVKLTKSRVATSDCVVLVTNHKAFDIKRIVKDSQLLFDTRNAAKGLKNNKIIRL